MGNTCTTILTKDSIEQNLNIKKETYNYKLYKKSRTNKNVKRKRNKVIDSNSIIYDNLQNSQQIIYNSHLDNTNKIYKQIDNKQIDDKQTNNESIDNKKCIKIKDRNIEEEINDNKKIKELNNYINLLEEELMNNTIISIKEKIEELDKKKAINNKITKLKNKNAKLFKSYIDLKKTSDSY